MSGSPAVHNLEQIYEALFSAMPDGCALYETILDSRGKPADYRYLAVNPAFERLTGLCASALAGKTLLEVMPGAEPYWTEHYGRVAMTGEPRRFEGSHAGSSTVFEVMAFRPSPGRFAAIFRDITAYEAREPAPWRSREEIEQAERITVLVVDDDEAIRGFFRRVLEDAGHQVMLAENGNQALALIRKGKFDLVITDLVMPECEGIEMIQAARKERPGMKIIAVSGAFGGLFLETAKVLGADTTLLKPVSPDRLLATVRELLV